MVINKGKEYEVEDTILSDKLSKNHDVILELTLLLWENLSISKMSGKV